MNSAAKFLIIAGAILIAAGLFWQLGGHRLPLGKLPGDIAIRRENFQFYFPLGTSILISAVLSLLLYLFRR